MQRDLAVGQSWGGTPGCRAQSCLPLLVEPAVLSCAVQQQRTKVFSAQHTPDLSYVSATCKPEGL